MPTNPLGYLITDEEWWMDMFINILIVLVGLLAILALTLLIFDPFWGFLIGVDVWLVLLGFALPYLSVAIPEATASMVQNYFVQPTETDAFANMRIYLTGWHPRKPWTRVVNYIDLRQVTVPLKEDFPAKNGVLVNFTGSTFYLPEPRWVPVYIAVSAETIKTALTETVTSYLSQEMANKKTPESARRSIKKFQDGTLSYLEEVKQQLAQKERETGLGLTFERRLGVNVTNVLIGDVGYDQKYQDALNSRARGGILQEMAAGWKDLTPKDAANAAFIVNGDVKKEIIEYEGAPEIARIIAESLIEAFRKAS